MPKIPRIQAGTSPPEFLVSAWVNKNVLDPLDAVVNMAILPSGSGKLIVNGAKATLDLTNLANSNDGNSINDVYVMINGTRYLTDLLTDGRLDPA